MFVLNQNLKGSTLIETIIAMVILVFVFSAGITVYHQVLSSSVNLQKVKAQQVALKAMAECQKEKAYFDAVVVGEDGKIVKKVEAAAWGADVYKVTIAVLGSKEDTLAVQRKICYVEE